MSDPDNGSLSLQLCGQARLQRAGTLIELPDGMSGYLLACLGVRGDWVLREELTALFWPEAATADAQRSLRVNLNRLRDRLAEWGASAALSCERTRVRWLPGSDVTRAREARARGDWPSINAIFLDAGGAGNGPAAFAPCLSFRGYPVLAEWADGERRALLSLSHEAVLRCAAVAPPATAAHLAARQMEAEPGDEDLLRTRLQALAAMGRHEDVAREFSAFDARHRQEMGTGASRAMAELASRLGPLGSGQGHAPAPPGALIGREQELAQAHTALQHTRLLTLTGLGGVGKTRFARALMAQGRPADTATAGAPGSATEMAAALWLPLQDLASVADIAHRVAPALGLPAIPAHDPVAQAAQLLAHSRVRLLVLDNAEHLLGQRDALRQLLDQWLQDAPQLRVLVTSREPLAHPAEQVMALRALLAHAPAASALAVDVLSAPAVRLLVAEVQRVRPGLDPREHRDTLARIAQHLGGLPLALHIAAKWLRLLSPTDVLAALQRGVDALDGSIDDPHGAPTAGIGATLSRSWQLLDAASQRSLAALSVWVSPFTAEAVVQAGAATLPTLARLMDHGLVEPHDSEAPAHAAAGATTDTPQHTAAPRLQLHPLVRSFAGERLAADHRQALAAHQAHADHVQRGLVTWTHWHTVDQRQALLAIGQGLPDALTAWQWALGQGRAAHITACAPVLCNYFETLCRWAEAIALFESAESPFDAQVPTELAALAALQRCHALLLFRDGRFDAAEAMAERALAWARQLGHGEGVKANLNTITLARWMLGRLDEALAAAHQASALALAEGDRAGQAKFTGNIALLQKKLGQFEQAEASWRQALAVHREVGNWTSVCTTLNNMGNLLRVLGRHNEAVALLDESLRLCDAYGFTASRRVALINLATTHFVAGRSELAEPLARQALEEVQLSGQRMLEIGIRLLLSELAQRGAHWGESAQQLGPALRAARAANDPANLLEGLSGYARWCLGQGRTHIASVAHATVLADARLHAELREELAASALAALPAAPASDLLALVEQACAELGTAARAQSCAPATP